ncbi:MAG: metallophosphoesterase family protein [Verrucomicrobia bacterium]|nr:metallophosphoesterase family protein [Verrucomicrobiota bacterium]
MKIALISDTHNYFDPRLPTLFEGVDHILHAGDIGQSAILDQLGQIAPVTAVLGNNDLGLRLRSFELIVLGWRKFLVHHIVNPLAPSEALRQRLTLEAPEVVVSGHSHKAGSGTIGPTFFINPGYAGRPRFGQPRSVAILHCEDRELRPEFLSL